MHTCLTALAVSLLTLALGTRAGAQGQGEPLPDGGAGSAAQGDRGELVLEVTPGARVAVGGDLGEGTLRLSLWHQDAPLGQQVARAACPAIESFSAVPVSRDSVRLDLRLAQGVMGVSVVRASPVRLEVHFASHRFAGSAVRMEAKAELAAADAEAVLRPDRGLAAALAAPMPDGEGFLSWPPVLWPVGTASPVQAKLDTAVGPHPFSSPPDPVREAWAGSPTVSAAVQLADAGDVVAASRLLARLAMEDDSFRATVALARGYAWSQPDLRGEPLDAGRAADAYLLAAALVPEAPWAAWARAQSGYLFGRERRWDEALIQYRKAIEDDPASPDRVYWELGRALCQIQAGRRREGVEHVVATAGGLPAAADGTRFAARRAVALALWEGGEHGAAAQVVDLLLAEHPQLAREPSCDLAWARIYFDAGRSAAALPFLERLEADGARLVDRERARWWLHEAALAHRDSLGARKWLRRILDSTPGSTLVPLVRIRLEVLDAIESGGRDPDLAWQRVALHLRDRALEWPHSPVEDEALSLAAQVFIDLGLLEDGLGLYRWVQDRTPTSGGAIAWQHVVCQTAPRAFHELRARGEVTRALGIYRAFLDPPSAHACVDAATRLDAATAAGAAGLPDLAARWLGQAIAESAPGAEQARNLIELSAIYRQLGRLDAAEQTLRYLEDAELPVPAGLLDAAWGDVLLARGSWEEAGARFSAAMPAVEASPRTRSLLPSLLYRRGQAHVAAGRQAEAAADLRAGVAAGGAEDEALGWLRVAQVEMQTASSEGELLAVLGACDAADAADAGAVRRPATGAVRAEALRALGRTAEADALLEAASLGSSAHAHAARESLAASQFDAALDELLASPPPSVP